MAIAILILSIAWWHHHRWQPYAFRFQNALESMLFATNILLLVLACIYAAIPEEMTGWRVFDEVLLLIALLGGILVAAIVIVRDALATRRAFRGIDFTGALLTANARLDGPVRERLRDGTIRLLRCDWIASSKSDAHLGRDHEGNVLIRRRQEMPDEAFFSP